MGKLLRIHGKPHGRVIAYDSPNTRSPIGVVVPRGTTRGLPRTATTALVRFYDAGTHRFVKGHGVILKADTVRKLSLE